MNEYILIAILWFSVSFNIVRQYNDSDEETAEAWRSMNVFMKTLVVVFMPVLSLFVDSMVCGDE